MTIDYSRNGDGTGTLVMTITAQQDRFEEILYNFGEAIFVPPSPEVTFSGLSTQEQLDIIETYIKRIAIAKDRSAQEDRALDNITIIIPEW